jgi:hypothetical protein
VPSTKRVARSVWLRVSEASDFAAATVGWLVSIQTLGHPLPWWNLLLVSYHIQSTAAAEASQCLVSRSNRDMGAGPSLGRVAGGIAMLVALAAVRSLSLKIRILVVALKEAHIFAWGRYCVAEAARD